MDVEHYRAARHRRLVETAIGLGVPEDRAAEVVDRVIEAQRRRILRSADPDEVVVPALREEVLGGRSRRPSLVVAGLVAVVGAAFAVPLLTPDAAPDRDEVEQVVATVPSLVGLTSTEAVMLLESSGITARVDLVPQCDPAGQVLGSVPRSGDTVRGDGVVRVVATTDADWACPPDNGRAEAWAFLRFLVSGSTRPHLAREVRLYVDGAASGTADGRQPATSSDWRWRLRDPVVASAVRPVANDLGQPVISITRGRAPRTTCGRRTPHPSGVTADPIRVVLVAGGPDDAPDACHLTIDLYQDDDGAISVVSVVLPGGVGLGPPAWVQTRDDLDALDALDAAGEG